MNLPKQGTFYKANGRTFYSAEEATFGGCDMVATITVPQLYNSPVPVQPVMVLGELQTVTYSTHAEDFPVRSYGSYNAKAFTKGPRTIAGTLIFASFDRYVFRKLADELKRRYSINGQTVLTNRILADELPPFNITVTFQNEHGNASKLVIYGVRIQDDSQVMSIEDMMTENTMSYYARDIVPMDPIVGQHKPPELDEELVGEENPFHRADRFDDFYIYGQVFNSGVVTDKDPATLRVKVHISGEQLITVIPDQDGMYFCYCKTMPEQVELADEAGTTLVIMTSGKGHVWDLNYA